VTAALAGLRPVGVALAVDGDGQTLQWRAADAGVMTPDLRAALAQAKPLLLAALPLCGPGAWAEVFEDDDHQPETLAAVLVALNDPDLRDHLRFIYDERAGIAEFDGGLSRKHADRVALAEVLAAAQAG
jgi:hypothetical protein